jgi:hypothetical protein
MKSNIKIPIYCCKKQNDTFAFCYPPPANGTDTQVAIFGKNYAKNIPRAATFTNIYMFPDDTINVVKQKIASTINGIKSTDIIKLTCHNVVTNPIDISHALSHQIFQGRRMIPTTELKSQLDKYIFPCDVKTLVDDSITINTAMKEIREILSKKGVNIVRYIENDASILESFAPDSNILYVTVEPHATVPTVPFQENAVYKQILKTYGALPEITNTRLNSFNKQVHVRVKPHIEVKDDIYSIFTLFKASNTIPFAKWLSQGNNAIIKVSKRFVMTIEGKKRVIVWSRIDKKKQYSTNEVIIFKVVPYKDTPITASIILYNTGVYDIKVNMIMGEKYKQYTVEGVLSDVQKIYIREIRNVEPTDFKSVMTVPRTNRLQVMNVLVQGAFLPNVEHDEKSMNIAMSSFGYIFHPVKSKNILDSTYLYKRTNGFNETGNVMNWISRIGFDQNKEIIQLFNNVDLKTIKSDILSWQLANPNHEKFTKYFKTSAKTIHLALRKSRNGFNYSLSGCTNQLEIDRIMMYTLVAIISTPRTETSKVAKKPTVHVSNSDDDDSDHDSDDLSDYDIDINDFLNNDESSPIMKKEMSPIKNNNIPGAMSIDQMMRMKINGECPLPIIKGGGGDRYTLTLLMAADRELFTTGLGPNTYAKACQASSSRQPIPMSLNELDYNKKCFEGAVSKPNESVRGKNNTMAIEAGQKNEKDEDKNLYTCPHYWCPISRVALTHEQYLQYNKESPFGIKGDKPMNFMGSYFTSKKRVIGKLDKNQHSKKLGMPCCFNKSDQNDGKQVKDSIKYIQGTTPSTDRYAALPHNLHHLFGNNKCGADTDDRRGHMQPDTKCFLRFGLEPSLQPFLMCIASVTNFKDDVEIINKIKSKLNLATFLTTDKGRLYQRFTFDAPWPNPGEENILYYKNEFVAFKSFMNDQFETLKTVFKIEGSLIETYMRPLKKFNPNIDEKNYHIMLLKRFYILYKSYTNFITYLDSSDKKTHENILPLLKKIKILDVNVIIIKEGEIECQENMNYQQECLILYQDYENNYDPVHFVTHEKSVVAAIKLHSFANSKILKQFGCEKKKTFEQQIANLTKKGTCLIDFEFRTIGCIYDDVLIPFKTPVYIENMQHVCFVDSFFKFGMSSLQTTQIQVCRVINGLNTCLNHNYIELQMRTDRYIDLSDVYVIPFIPLSGCTDSDVDVTKFYIDGNIFSTIQYNDDRSNYVSVEVYKHALFETLLNEVITLYIHVEDVKDEVDFIRHPNNPLTINEKITYLRKFFIEKSPLKKRFFTLNAPLKKSLINVSMPPSKLPIVCSKLQETQCMANNLVCTWIPDDGTGKGKKNNGKRSICKVKFSSDVDFEIFMDKAMYYMTNPINPLVLKVQQGNKKNPISDDDTLMYEQKNVGELDTQLTQFNFRKVDFDIVELQLEHIKVKHVDELLLKLSLKQDKLAIIQKVKDVFHMKSSFKLSKITEDSIYTAFLIAYNMQVGVNELLMSVDQFKFRLAQSSDTKSLEDLIRFLANETNVNIIITNQASKTDILRPIYEGSVKNKLLMMFHMSEDKMLIYYKKGKEEDADMFIYDMKTSPPQVDKNVFIKKYKR